MGGIGRRGDYWLIEGDGNHFVAAEVADVSDLDGEIVTRLPLKVERVIDGVGQLVGAVIGGEGEERRRCAICLLTGAVVAAGTGRCWLDCRWERGQGLAPRD